MIDISRFYILIQPISYLIWHFKILKCCLAFLKSHFSVLKCYSAIAKCHSAFLIRSLSVSFPSRAHIN